MLNDSSEAPDITIKAGSNITFQAGEAGGGTITFAAGSITTKANNKSDQVSAESVEVETIRRLNLTLEHQQTLFLLEQSITRLLETKKVEITGISHWKTVVGGPGQLIKDRTVGNQLLLLVTLTSLHLLSLMSRVPPSS